MESDPALLAAWSTGDTRAGSRLFERHYDRLVRFFRNKVGDEYPDLIQQTMLKCLESHHRLQEAEKFSAFLLGIARNVLLHHLRTRARKHDKLDFGVTSMADLQPGVTTNFAQRHRDRLLFEALRQLAVDDQILLELYYWEDLPARELAQLHGIPEGTVRTRLRAARQRLERVLPKVARGLGLEPTDTESNLEEWARETRALLSDAVNEPD